jgi:hypothetical protein
MRKGKAFLFYNPNLLFHAAIFGLQRIVSDFITRVVSGMK